MTVPEQRRRCLYEILDVPRTVDDDELKKNYRKMALKEHPDKNMQDPEGAKQRFQEIQAAYETLSDPQERAWYDSHREAILRNGGIGEGAEADIGGIDLFQFFDASCFKGYDDLDEKSFYNIYGDAFAVLADEDSEWDEDAPETYPAFGNAESPSYEWQPFYAFFTSYITPRHYSWLDQYDTRQAPNRRVARLMEKDNKKFRDAARKERNELVRSLAKFIYKRDPRIQKFNKELEERAKVNAAKTADLQRRHLEERAEMFEQVKTQKAAASPTGLEEDLQKLENEYDSDLEQDENFCVMCNKQLRNYKAFKSHQRQAAHLEKVEELKTLISSGELEGAEMDVLGKLDLGQEEKKEEVPEEQAIAAEGEDAKEQNGEPEKESVVPTKTKKGKKNKGKKKTENTDLTCKVCREEMPSKTKLHKHLKETGHATAL